MIYIIFLLIIAGAWFIGVMGWAQIVGSFQNASVRGKMMTAITICIWSCIIVGSFILVWNLWKSDIVAWIIGMVISLIQVFRAGKIE